MIRFVVSLLLLNTFYCSLGYPVNETSISYGPLAKSLQLLASSCENSFLASQVQNKIDVCNFPVTVKAMLESKFECFIFYDINSQLCAAYRGSKLDLSQAYATRMNEVQKVQTTCDLAKNWKFTKLTEFPMYNMSERLFKTQVTCVKACGVDDLLSEDTNFYCKYFQWGTEMLQHLITASPLTGNMPSGESGPDSALVETPPKLESSSAPTSRNDSSIKLQNTNEVVQPSLGLSNLESNRDLKPDPATSTNAGQQGHNANVIDEPNKVVSALAKPEEVSNKNEIKEVPPNKKSDEEFLHPSDGKDSKAKETKESGKNEPKDDVELDDDNENEFDPDDDPSPESQQINDGGDTGVQPDPKLEDEKAKTKDAASIVSNVNIDMSHRVPEFNTNTLPDGFAEDDDHFFSFFLTAIILVIVLYVLYHNKSKFKKVIFGLLVEGRQSGRRRNSRGHEYRRLDTLEQAMSTNSTAPPSKIIY